MDKIFLPLVSGVIGALFVIVASKFILTQHGRVIHTPTQEYDLFGNVVSSAYLLDVGAQVVPAGKELHAVRLTGELIGENKPAYLNGLVFNFVNSSQAGGDSADSTRVRAIIGQVVANGNGSVRAIHVHALANPGARGMINAADFQVSPRETTARATAVQIASTGVRGKGDGIWFSQAPGSNYRFGLNMAEMGTRYDRAAIYLPLGETNSIQWENGTRLFLDHDGELKVKFVNGAIKVLVSP